MLQNLSLQIKENKMMDVHCIVCTEFMAKYSADISGCVYLKQGYVCDDCSYAIAKQRIAGKG